MPRRGLRRDGGSRDTKRQSCRAETQLIYLNPREKKKEEEEEEEEETGRQVKNGRNRVQYKPREDSD